MSNKNAVADFCLSKFIIKGVAAGSVKGWEKTLQCRFAPAERQLQFRLPCSVKK